MEILKINPKLVTHLKVFNRIKGVYDIWGNVNQYIYLPQITKKFLFWSWIEQEAGYYRHGRQSSFSPVIKELDPKYKDVDGILFSNPHVEIYNGKVLLTIVWFSSYEEVEEFVNTNFPEVNIIIK